MVCGLTTASCCFEDNPEVFFQLALTDKLFERARTEIVLLGGFH